MAETPKCPTPIRGEDILFGCMLVALLSFAFGYMVGSLHG